MSALKKIWDVVSTVVVACIVILALLLVGVRIAGYDVYTILSGSMEPTYHVGSIIYVKSVDYRELRVGDPITFMLNEDTVATHRIVEVIPDPEDASVIRYRTKGDANASEDGGLVHYKNVIGRPEFTIPYLGYVASYIQNPPGTYVAIAFGAAFLLLMFLPDIFAEDKDKAKKRSEKPRPSEKAEPAAAEPDEPRRSEAPAAPQPRTVTPDRTQHRSEKRTAGKHTKYVGKH